MFKRTTQLILGANRPGLEVKVGLMASGDDQLLDNLQCLIEGLDLHLPRGALNIKQLKLRSQSSRAYHLYAASIIDEHQIETIADLSELDPEEQARSMLYDEYKKKVQRHRAAIKQAKMEKKKATKRKASSILDRFHQAKKARFMCGKSLYDAQRPVISFHNTKAM